MRHRARYAHRGPVPTDEEIGFPTGTPDERELLLKWLTYLRGAVVRNIEGLSDTDARWTPDGALISVLGIVNHLTHVEWRWIDGAMLGQAVSRERVGVHSRSGAHRRRGAGRLSGAGRGDGRDGAFPVARRAVRRADGTDLRWVLLHLINETARHAGHADATRELLDGARGE